MRAGDRVRLVDEESNDPEWPSLGTITKVSPLGYVTVEWDDNVIFSGVDDGLMTPKRAQRILRVVFGEDAKKLHDWMPKAGWMAPSPKIYRVEDYKCKDCGVEQTEENYREKCEKQ